MIDATTTLAFFDRPDTSILVVAFACIAVGAGLLAWVDHSARPPGAEPTGEARPAPVAGQQLESPAVVGLLTNGFTVPRTAVTATALDLAARGWVQLSTVEDEVVVVTRGAPAAGDSLLPYEQQVLNHMASRAFNDLTSANTLAASHHRLDRRWWFRFERAVVADAAARGLATRRDTPVFLAPVAALATIALIAWWFAGRRGDEIALTESWRSRVVWFVLLVAVVVLAWEVVKRLLGGAGRPTAAGLARRDEWMGFRRRLVARIPDHASVLGAPAQQRALAEAVVMGVATQVLDELPVGPDDPRVAWSDAGGTPHLVRVRYPFRPGYGQHPMKVAAVGIVVLLLGRWLQGFLERVERGEALQSLLDKAPGQVDLLRDVAGVLALLCWLPILWACWAVIAGIVDSAATRSRTGAIVRARRPAAVLPPLVVNVVRPFAERDRFTTYLAVDDGKRRTVWAWLASERTAAPQGAAAKVRATPMLGFVRSSEPVGTATRGAATVD